MNDTQTVNSNPSKTVTHHMILDSPIINGDKKSVDREFRLSFLMEKGCPTINLQIDDRMVPVEIPLEALHNDDIFNSNVSSKQVFSKEYSISNTPEDSILSFASDLINKAQMPNNILHEVINQILVELSKKDSKISTYFPRNYKMRPRLNRNIDCGYDLYAYAVVMKQSTGEIFMTSYKSGNNSAGVKWTFPFARIFGGKPLEDALFKGLHSRFNIELDPSCVSGSMIIRGKNERTCLNFVYICFLPNDYDTSNIKNGEFFYPDNLPESAINLTHVILEHCFEETNNFNVLDLNTVYNAASDSDENQPQ